MYMIVDNTELYKCYLTAIERNHRGELVTAGSDEVKDAKLFKSYKDAFNYFMPLVKEQHSGRHDWTITPVHLGERSKWQKMNGTL